MDNPNSHENYVPSQVKKLREMTDINIIAAEDGLKIWIKDIS